MIDRDEDGYPTEVFYAEAEPCESCGEPTFKGRVWNFEHEIWVAVDCSCNTPSLPTCPALIPELERAETVRQVSEAIRKHRISCPLCKPVEMPSAVPTRKAA